MGFTNQRRLSGLFGGEARTASSDTAESVLRFWMPRYWRVWLIIAWLRVVACLPWRWSIALHKWFGRHVGSRSRRLVKVVRGNLKLCFPALSERERDDLAMKFYANMGAVIAEIAMAWFASAKRLRALFQVDGVEHLERALARGKGVILCAGHFTPIEICTPIIKDYVPWFTFVYNNRSSRLLSEYQRRYRARHAHEAFPKGDARSILKSLRRNGTVWLAADESSRAKSAVLVPFFGEPAFTNTAVSRLARISGASVVPLFFCRKPDESGYLLRFDPALEDFPSDDVVEDTKRLMAILEDSIRQCPAQYFWSQKRFRQRSKGSDQS